ncbi:MAG: ATP-binding cassette domain-containing protein [Bacteroidota bacterium]
MSPWTPIKRFWSLLRLDRREIYFVYFYAILSGIITLSLPLGIQAIISLIAGGAISTSLYVLIAVVVVGTTMTGILKVMQLTVTETIQRRIFARSSFEFAYRIPLIQLDNLQGVYPPELVNRFFDTLTIQKGLPKILMDVSTAILQIVFGIILISFYHSFFVIFGLILILVVFLIFRYTAYGGLKTSLKESAVKYEVAHWLEELARAKHTFKLSDRNSFSLTKTNDLTVNWLNSRKAHFRILIVQAGSVVGFKALITGALLAIGSILVVDNQINIGQFVAAEIVVILILNSVEKLIQNMETIYDVVTGITKIGTVMDLPLDRVDGLKPEEDLHQEGIEIELRNVSFQFEGDIDKTLDDISLDIAAGEKVCITGYNRAGKSTLIHLLAGMYNEFEGYISVDGLPFKDLCLYTFRNRIGKYTSGQDLFKGTIEENILMGRKDPSVAHLIEVSEMVGLHEFVKKLPKGYNTNLLPGGVNVPGSVRHKIVMARTLANDPQLMVMEDDLGTLESTDRERLINLLVNPDRHWTFIVVTDDPELAKRCDKVVIMRKGRIVETGTYQQIRGSEHYDEVFHGKDKHRVSRNARNHTFWTPKFKRV